MNDLRDPRGEIRPPGLALWLLERRVSGHEREFLVGDLVETFHASVGAGMSPRVARRQFWREALFASVRVERDTESLPFHRSIMTDLTLDLTLALRRLRRTPGFTLAASLTLALGVGAACAIVAVARPALWGALPFREADRIVTLRELSGDGSPSRLGFTTIKDLERRVSGLQSVAAARDLYATLTTDDGAVRLTGMGVSATWLDVMGVRPALGRGFLPEEDQPDAPRAIMLSDELWRRQFSADTAIIGRSITLTDLVYQVVGVLPASYESVLLPGVEILVPLRYADTLGFACRDCRHLQAVARVKPNVPLAEATRQVNEAGNAMRQEFPSTYSSNGFKVTPLRDQLVEGIRGPLMALLGAAALLLLIALANATNLFVARTVQRGDEATIRAALGASRWRLVRGMVIEALVVSTLGALFGLAIASSVIGTLVALAPVSLPRIDQVRFESSIVLLAAALALALGVASGLLPAWMLRIGAGKRRLMAGSRTVVRSGQDTLRRALVIIEMALALLLLGGAGILVRSVERLMAVDPGFTPNGRLTAALGVGGPRYASDDAIWSMWSAVREAVASVPGVRAAALTSQLPLSSDFDGYGLRWQGRTPVPGGISDGFRFAVTPDYAQAMGLQLVAGRFLEQSDVRYGAPVAVIGAYLAQREFGDKSPIGAQVRIGGEANPWRTVVGVVKDVRHPTLDAPPGGQIYLPLDQNHFADGHVRLVVHSDGDLASLVRPIREAIRNIDPGISVAETESLDDVVTATARQRLFARRVFQVFSLAALMLAAVGIFGVMSGMVGERTREIAVRSALGASQGRIVGQFVRQGATMVGIGLVIGTAGALALGGALESLVYGLSSRDPITLLMVGGILAAVALFATWWPATRAARVDAAVALRGE